MQFFRMAWLNFKGQRVAFNLKEFILLQTLYPFITLVFYCIMAAYAYNTQNVVDWVIGNAFLLCTNTCIFSLGTCFMSERYYGRIRSIMVGSVSKFQIVLQKGFFSGVVCVVTTGVGFLAGCLIFKIPILAMNLENMFCVLMVGMFAATGFGMFLSAVGLLSDQMHFILNTVQYVLIIFTGSNVPIEKLPKLVQPFSWMLPFTRSVIASRSISKGLSIMDCKIYLEEEIIVGLAYFMLAVGAIKIAEHMAIKKGTIDLF